MKNLQHLFLILFFVSSYHNAQAQLVSDLKKTGTQIFNDRAAVFANQIKQTENPQIIDIRTPREYQAGHLKNAILINFYDPNFAKNIEKANLDKNKPIFIYCRSGNRSGHAIRIFKELGFKDIHNLVYGINEWYQMQLPLEK